MTIATLSSNGADMDDLRTQRLREALARHEEATNRVVASINATGGHEFAPSPNTVRESLEFIRTLQEVADILDEIDLPAALGREDVVVREALQTVAVSVLTRDVALARSLGERRPFRYALKRVFPNDLIRSLKLARDAPPDETYDA